MSEMAARERYRLKQGGIPVAWAEGAHAANEIAHYAAVYRQDAPVSVEKHIAGKWRPWPPRSRRSPPALALSKGSER